MNSTLQQMIDLMAEVDNASSQLAFNLSVAVKKDFLHDEFLEDLEFDVHRLNMFARAVRDAWGYYGR
jgi:hypothetical protein